MLVIRGAYIRGGLHSGFYGMSELVGASASTVWVREREKKENTK